MLLRAGILTLLATLFLNSAVQAEMPPHLTLAKRCPPYSTPLPLRAQPYPYGFFGAHGSTHWQRQFGIYRNYTQWSQK